MARFLWICVGGGLGSGARYLVALWAGRTLGPGFPWGTLLVNVAGCFLLGAVMHLGLVTQAIPPDLRLVLATGVLGGFTTYSTFNYETLRYLEEGAWLLALANACVTLVLGLLAGLAGVTAARALGGG